MTAPKRTVIVYRPVAAPRALLELILMSDGRPLPFEVRDAMRADLRREGDLGIRRLAAAARYAGFELQLALTERTD